MTVIYSSTLIETNFLSSPFLQYKSVRCLISSEKSTCHQYSRKIQYPPQALSELSPYIFARGIRLMICARWVEKEIPESGRRAWVKNFNSAAIDALTGYFNLDRWTICAACLIAKLISFARVEFLSARYFLV